MILVVTTFHSFFLIFILTFITQWKVEREEGERVSLSPDNHHHHDHSKFKGRQRERERRESRDRKRGWYSQRERNGKEMKSEVFMFGVCVSLYTDTNFLSTFLLSSFSFFLFLPPQKREKEETTPKIWVSVRDLIYTEEGGREKKVGFKNLEKKRCQKTRWREKFLTEKNSIERKNCFIFSPLLFNPIDSQLD